MLLARRGGQFYDSTIKSVIFRIEGVKAFPSFNSTTVRLKARVKIKDLALISCFNSTTVRLKVSRFSPYKLYLIEFQFYDSTIKRTWPGSVATGQGCFNSTTVRLKEKQRTMKRENLRCFNSTTVRLKALHVRASEAFVRCFNSTTVRLKA